MDRELQPLFETGGKMRGLIENGQMRSVEKATNALLYRLHRQYSRQENISVGKIPWEVFLALSHS